MQCSNMRALSAVKSFQHASCVLDTTALPVTMDSSLPIASTVCISRPLP